MKKKFEYLSRVYWDIVYRVIRYQFLFYAAVFTVFAVLLLQYWNTISQQPTQSYSENIIGGTSVQMWTPDRMYIGEENQQQFEFVIDALAIPADTLVTITVDSPDENVGLTNRSLSFKVGDMDADANKVMGYYRNVASPAKSFDVQATIKIGNNQGDISRTVILDSQSKSTMVFISSVSAGLLALLNLINRNYSHQNWLMQERQNGLAHQLH